MTDQETSFGIIRYYLGNFSTATTEMRHLSSKKLKLLLLSTSYTGSTRARLQDQIKNLLKKKIIRKYGKKDEPDMRDVQDVIIDYLTGLLQHTKSQLVIHEGYTDTWKVEFDVATPAILSPKASRILKTAMEAAIPVTGFVSLTDGEKSGQVIGGSIDNLFIAPEPECGMTWLLHNPPPAHEQVMAGNVINCMNYGGGTVDSVAYEVGRDYLLRLGEQIIPPGDKLWTINFVQVQ
ncbi:hypothetical protein ONS96_000547 [Cadophora gregata f. sp. sojae]|nr:hypothetical protein ONS96_000547 [Cadophora gregata f. sp. sojae]